MPNTHNIGDVSSNTISYQHNAGLYYVYATIPTDNTWYTMMTSINDSACNFRGVCGDASSKIVFTGILTQLLLVMVLTHMERSGIMDHGTQAV